MQLYSSLARAGLMVLAVLLSLPLAYADNQAAQSSQGSASQAQPQSSAVTPSDRQLDTLADITVKAKKIERKHLPALAKAKNDQQRAKIRKQMQGEAVHLIKDEGMSLDEYKKVVLAVKQDPKLKNRLRAKIKSKIDPNK